jgi:hypothetical protein
MGSIDLARRLASPLRAIYRGQGMEPGFLVIGTKRGGSTSCYEWIAQHPQVAPCRTGKGTHYFDVNYPRGEAWFRSGFPHQRDPWRVTGEGSPYYMFHPAAPERIARTLPEVRLIAVLRDPVERAWSHYKYEVSRGHETLDLVEALDAEPERLRGEEERLLADPAYVSTAHRYHTYLQRGHYAEQLSRIFEYVDRERVLVLRSEELFADPHEQLARVWSFLGLDRVDLEGLRAFKAGAEVSSVPAGVAQRLTAYYEPHNAALRSLTGIDVATVR